MPRPTGTGDRPSDHASVALTAAEAFSGLVEDISMSERLGSRPGMKPAIAIPFLRTLPHILRGGHRLPNDPADTSSSATQGHRTMHVGAALSSHCSRMNTERADNGSSQLGPPLSLREPVRTDGHDHIGRLWWRGRRQQHTRPCSISWLRTTLGHLPYGEVVATVRAERATGG